MSGVINRCTKERERERETKNSFNRTRREFGAESEREMKQFLIAGREVKAHTHTPYDTRIFLYFFP